MEVTDAPDEVGFSFHHEGGIAPEEIVPVVVIAEDDLAVQPPAYHVVEDTGGVEAHGAGHSKGQNII